MNQKILDELTNYQHHSMLEMVHHIRGLFNLTCDDINFYVRYWVNNQRRV